MVNNTKELTETCNGNKLFGYCKSVGNVHKLKKPTPRYMLRGHDTQ